MLKKPCEHVLFDLWRLAGSYKLVHDWQLMSLIVSGTCGSQVRGEIVDPRVRVTGKGRDICHADRADTCGAS